MSLQLRSLVKNLGPGLLFAGASIGVSHLVQSTRAGADYGFGLLWALLLVNLFKYPFFQYGPRYATATGESLIDGYRRLGKWVLAAYFVLTFLTMFTIQAAVTIVTAGLANNLFGITSNMTYWSLWVTLVCLGILLLGQYKALDLVMKVIVSILAISSVAAVLVAAFKTEHDFTFIPLIPTEAAGIAFLIAFLGWMPSPLDVSAWHSLWTIEKMKDMQGSYDSRRSLFDFNIGYAATVFLGVCFITLGALVMFHSGEEVSSNASQFARQLISMYTENLGKGASIFIAVAAFTTMFSTTLTTLDASPRAMARSTEILLGKRSRYGYYLWIMLLSVGTIVILAYFKTSMITFVKVATILSFLTAPFYAIANFTLVCGKHMPPEKKPGKALRFLSYLGIVFLIAFSAWYLINMF